jgi:hypothetical protein
VTEEHKTSNSDELEDFDEQAIDVDDWQSAEAYSKYLLKNEQVKVE